MIRPAKYFFHTNLFLLRLDKTVTNYTLPENFTLHKLKEDDLDTVASAHRNKKIVEERLKSGYKAYWLEHDDRCVNIQWYSVEDFFVWDIRSIITFSSNSFYLFDGFTAPNFRGQGLNKASLAALIKEEQLLTEGAVFSLVQHNNPMGWGFLEKFGFIRTAEISLTQIPPIRRYHIKKNGANETSLKMMRAHNKPVCLDLDTLTID